MPKIDMAAYNDAAESTGGGYKRLTAGGYVARIIAVRDRWTDSYGNVQTAETKQYVKLIFDIDEGDLRGMFSDDFWSSQEKDYGHWLCLSWKNLCSLKGNVKAIEESNPGFDVMQAINSDRWYEFIGRKVGIVVGEETYTGNDGEVRTRCKLPNIRSVQSIKEGKFKVPELDTSATNGLKPGESRSGASSDSAGAYDIDVPF